MPKPTKTESLSRKDKVKELMLKGTPVGQIAKQLDVTARTIYLDIADIQASYAKMILNNPNLAEKQYLEVQKLRDEVTIIKKEFYDIYENIKAQEAQNKIEHEHSKTLVEGKLLEPSKLVEIKDFSYKKLDTLKAIMLRIEQDSRLLNLFNPSKLIVNNYISINNLKQILDVVKGIIIDVVPDDKKQMAFDRLKEVSSTATSNNQVIEAEYSEPKPSEPVPEQSENEDKPINQ